MNKQVSVEIPTVIYRPPRRDSWFASLDEDARLDILSLREQMNWEEAVKYIFKKYGKKVSRSAYYRALDQYKDNRLAALQLKAASTPPALQQLKEISDTVKSINETLKAILAAKKTQSR